jgi:UDP-glucose 4-epimerase
LPGCPLKEIVMVAPKDGTVVITGGCGFIGSHLTRRISQSGRRVRVIDDLSNGRLERLPPGVEFRKGDVADPDFVRAAVADASVVFHLAAVASVQVANERWLASQRTNSGGTVALMEALRDVAPEVPFIYASSAAVYGDVTLAPGERINEQTPVRPMSPYGVDKLASELHARVAGSLFAIASFGLRFFNVFGPGQAPDSPYSGVISRFIAQARAGEPLTIFGDGGQSRDFVHVDDVVGALLAAEQGASADASVVNICTGEPTSVGDLARRISAIAGGGSLLLHLPARQGDIRHSLGDPSLAAARLHWRAEVAVSDGLAGLVQRKDPD